MSDSTKAGDTIANKIGAVGNIIKGFGDKVRGEFNSFADKTGDKIASRHASAATAEHNVTSTTQHTVHVPETSAEVASKGESEFKQGVAELK